MRNTLSILPVLVLGACTTSPNGVEAGDCPLAEHEVSDAHPSPVAVDEAEASIPARAEFQVLWTPAPHDDTTFGPPRQTGVTVEWTRLATPATVAQRGYQVVEVDGQELGILTSCVEGEYLRLEYAAEVHLSDHGFEASGSVVVQVDADGGQLLLTEGAMLDDGVDLSPAWVEDSPTLPDHQATAWRVGMHGKPTAPQFSVDGLYDLDDGTQVARGLWEGVAVDEVPPEN